MEEKKSSFSDLMPDANEPRFKILVNNDKMWESFQRMIDKSEVFSKAFDAALDDQGLQWDGNHIIIGEKSHKFKEGDWIVDALGHILYVENIFNSYYEVTDPYTGKTYNYNVQCADDDCHLWSVRDAKPGDILKSIEHDSGDETIYIFKELKWYDEDNTTIIGTYCFSRKEHFYSLNACYIGRSDKNDTYPATKEQKEILFSKMKDAGYEWDPDNLKLKKIVKDDNHDGISTFPRNPSAEDLSTFRETAKKYADALKDDPREKAIQAEIESWFSKPAPDSYKGLSDFEISLYKMIKYIEPFVVAHDNERIKIAIKAYSNQFGKILKGMEQIDKSSDVIPKFKIGDIVKADDSYISYIIIDIVDDTYKMVSLNRNGDIGNNLRYSVIKYQNQFKLA